MERATTGEGENEMARQSLELLHAFKRIDDADLRECIVQVVGLLRQTPSGSWPALKSALVKVLC